MGVLYARSGGQWVPVAQGSADQRWFSAWGVIWRSTPLGGAGVPLATGATLSLTGPGPMTFVNGRRYRIAGSVRAITPTTAGQPSSVYFRVTNVPGGTIDSYCFTTSGYTGLHMDAIIVGDGQTWTPTFEIVNAALVSVPMTLYLDGPGSNLYIEDVGPVTGAALIPQVAVTAWTAPTLLNGWTNTGGTYQVAQYRLFGDLVQLRGRIAGGTVGQTIFTLPAGFCPPAAVTFAASSLISGNWAYGPVEIAPSGVVLTYAPSVSAGLLLNNIQFSVTT